MNDGTKIILGFLAGAGIGSVVTWKVLEKKIDAKYAQIAQEEIDSVKAEFERRLDEINGVTSRDEKDENPQPQPEEEEEAEEDYDEKLETLGYAEPAEEQVPAKEKNYKKRYSGSPYVILPECFGEFDDYKTISLTYYADHILTDDDDTPIDDIEKYIGIESLNHFGEYEDDSVYVRNDNLRCDYEILLDHRKYSDVAKTKPPQEMI